MVRADLYHARHAHIRPGFMQKQHDPLPPTVRQGTFAAPAPRVALPVRTRQPRPAPAVSMIVKLAAPGIAVACLSSGTFIGTGAMLALTLATFALLVAITRFAGRHVSGPRWAREAGFGETVWLNRLSVAIPREQNARLTTLYAVFWAGLLVAAWGALGGVPLLAASGLVVAYSAQFSGLKQLIGLYCAMRDTVPLYRFWDSAPVNDNRAGGDTRQAEGMPDNRDDAPPETLSGS